MLINALSKRKFDNDGRLKIALCNISKEDVNPYYGYEIPDFENLGLQKDKIYYLYRPGEELKKAEKTFDGIQLLEKHIPVFADDTQKDHVIGCTGTEAKFERPYLKNSLNIWDKDAIDMIEAADEDIGGANQLSCGYSFRADMTPGEFNGKKYDGKMIDIKGNHVALVENGRAGSDVKVADGNKITEVKMLRKKRKLVMDRVKAMDLDLDDSQLDKLCTEIGKVHQELMSLKNDRSDKSEAEDGNLEIEGEPELDPETEAEKEMIKLNQKIEDKKNKMMDRKKRKMSDEEEDFDADEEDKDDGYENQLRMTEDESDEEDDEDEDEKEERKEKAEDRKMKKAMDSLESKIRKDIFRKMKQINEAKDIVRNIVGDINNIHNAEQIYRFALEQMGVRHNRIKDFNALKEMCIYTGNNYVNKKANNYKAMDSSLEYSDNMPDYLKRIKIGF